jgi:hypothetical protein
MKAHSKEKKPVAIRRIWYPPRTGKVVIENGTIMLRPERNIVYIGAVFAAAWFLCLGMPWDSKADEGGSEPVAQKEASPDWIVVESWTYDSTAKTVTVSYRFGINENSRKAHLWARKTPGGPVAGVAITCNKSDNGKPQQAVIQCMAAKPDEVLSTWDDEI